MQFEIAPSHVAILVPSVLKTANFLSQFKLRIGEPEIWDGEGTREIYVELGRANSLLLMEPIRAGAYQRAMDKRGPGFHHIAIDVVGGLTAYLDSIKDSGWLLHFASSETMKTSKTAYLYRAGFPGLIEVQDRETLNLGAPFVREVYLDFEVSVDLVCLGLSKIVLRGEPKIQFGDQSVKIPNLF